jgi:hypothetical protein
MNALTQDPYLNSNTTLPDALDSVNTSLAILQSLSSQGVNISSAVQQEADIISNVQNEVSESDCAMATTFSSEATNQTYQYLEQLSNLILQNLSVGQQNVITTSSLILYSAIVSTSNLSNFTIALDSAAPAITFGNFTGQNVPNSVAITYTYSMNKQGCTNNPSPDFTLEVKDPVSLQPLQNFNVPISVVYSKSTFGNIQCTETGCQATTDSNGNTVCACSDISVFDVKNQLARIYQNSELRYLTINNLLDALSHPPYTKWSFWVIIGYSV